MTPKEIEKIVAALSEMRVELSPEPQTEPYDYIHMKLAEIHRHYTYLMDLITKVNRWKSKIDQQVKELQKDHDLKYTEAMVTHPDVLKRNSATDRKAAANYIVREDKEKLCAAELVQTDITLLAKLLKDKKDELYQKSVDVKVQKRTMDAEWAMTGQYRQNGGTEEDESGRSKFAPDLPEDQTPTAEDLDLPKPRPEVSISKISNLEETSDEVEVSAPTGVQVSSDPGGLEGVTAVPPDEAAEEQPVDEGLASPEEGSSSPNAGDVDLDALLADVVPESKRRDTEEETAVDRSEPVQPALTVSESEDLDSLLDAI